MIMRTKTQWTPGGMTPLQHAGSVYIKLPKINRTKLTTQHCRRRRLMTASWRRRVTSYEWTRFIRLYAMIYVIFHNEISYPRHKKCEDKRKWTTREATSPWMRFLFITIVRHETRNLNEWEVHKDRPLHASLSPRRLTKTQIESRFKKKQH